MKMRPFEIAILAGFGFMFVAALILVQVGFGSGGGEEEVTVGTVEIWGTVSADSVNRVLAELKDEREGFGSVSYRSFDSRQFDTQLVNAVAEGRGPDIVIMPHTKLVDQLPKLNVIPYESFPQRQFQDTYIDGTELFLLPQGVAGYPFALDPLVLYWNRDILASGGFAAAPTTWEMVVNSLVPSIVERDFDRNILVSPIALGEYRNVENAYAILSALMLQGGSRMVGISGDGGSFNIALNSSTGNVANPATNALEFYTSFATANNPLYSWSRSKPQDTASFTSGDVALYLGKGSEYKTLARRNPNLNFDIAELPQSANSRVKRTYADIYGFFLLRSSDNTAGASTVMQTLAGDSYYAGRLAGELQFAPVHRATLSAGTNNAVDQVRFTSALYARGWYNPELQAAESALQQMVESVLATRASASAAVQDAMVRLQQAF